MVDSQEPRLNPSSGGKEKMKEEKKKKMVVIMGPTGSGKSKLAVDLASDFPIEIINADSMQVYRGLDVLTNKVPIEDQKGVPHHLLGTISPNVEFTAKDFRDSAVALIDEILSRNNLPVLVGGTNYYIQAVVSRFLLDDLAEDMEESCINEASGDENMDTEPVFVREQSAYGYDLLKDIDPVAANRVHPNNHRKVNQYLNLYARSGILPSKLYQGKAVENWGQVDNLNFDCCLICVDAEIPVLDRYVEQRVDCMVDAGLLDEVYDIYNPNADYTKGLKQAIGVREFEDFLAIYLSKDSNNDQTEDELEAGNFSSLEDKVLKENLRGILESSTDNQLKILLEAAIDKVKLNTRRLLRRQKRRVNRLETVFGWNIHHVDATQYITSRSEESWAAQVVKPSVQIIESFLKKEDPTLISDPSSMENSAEKLTTQRDLWTQYVCKACGDKILRGSHEWEQHRQGRGHRKRISSLKKSQRAEAT